MQRICSHNGFGLDTIRAASSSGLWTISCWEGRCPWISSQLGNLINRDVQNMYCFSGQPWGVSALDLFNNGQLVLSYGPKASAHSRNACYGCGKQNARQSIRLGHLDQQPAPHKGHNRVPWEGPLAQHGSQSLILLAASQQPVFRGRQPLNMEAPSWPRNQWLTSLPF